MTSVIAGISITRANPQHAYAAAPDSLNFQARLLNASGAVAADGNYHVEFKLYNVATGGTAEWTETRTTGNLVPVKAGYLSVHLGDVTAFPGSIDWTQQHWLTMNIGGNAGSPTWDGEMTPRIQLTAVPYAFAATQAAKALTLEKNTGSFTGTVDFSTLTADRKFLFPDTSLATTASPGTICVYNGGTSNCPAATGSAYYIHNDTALQLASNFNIQAKNDAGTGTDGTVAGILRGAAGGQTVDLLQFQATGGTVLGAVTAGGNLQVASSVDTRTAGTLSIGTATANAISIGSTGVTATVNGALTVTQAFTANGGATIVGNTTIATTAGNTLGLGNSTGTLTVTGNNTSTFVIDGVTIDATEFGRLDGKDAPLVDTNDAVATAITGTGALTVGSINWSGAIATSGNISTSGSGTISSASTVTGTQLISTVATGTAPLMVTSTTLVSNLNANYLGAVGQDAAFFRDASNLNAGTVGSARISGAYNGLTGSTALATVGTITAGTWQGTAIADAYVADNLTISSSGTVDWAALNNYPAACAAGSALTQLGDTVTCTAFATGTAGSFIQNGTSVQTNANFYARSAAIGSVAGVLEGTNGQTADLLDLNSYNGTTSTTVASFTAAGNLKVANSIDTQTATAFNIGTGTATSIVIGKTSGQTLRVGQNGGTLQLDGTNFDLSTAGVATFAGGQTADITTAGATTLKLDTGGSAAISIGAANASALSISRTGVLTTVNGGLTVTQLLTGQLGTAITGGNIDLNASSNFVTNINTGTSTGAVNIGNAAAGAISLQSGSTVSVVSGTTLSLTSTGANNLTLTPGGASNTGVLIKPTTNSTAAFQIQNAAGTANVLTADTTNGQVILGTSNVLSGQLVFKTSGDSNSITLTAPTNVGASYTLALPQSTPTTGLCLATANTNANQLVFTSCFQQVSNAPVSHVGAGWSNNGANITTINVSPTGPGNLLVLSAGLQNNQNIVSISGGGVTSWQPITSGHSGTGSLKSVELWRGVVTSTGASTVTITFSGSAGTTDLAVDEYTMNSAYGTWSVDTSSTQFNAASATINMPSLLPQSNSELYAGYAFAGGAPVTASSATFRATTGGAVVYSTSSTSGVPTAPTATQTSSASSYTIGATIIAFANNNVIINSTTGQLGNFNVTATTAGTVTGVLQAASSGTADILDFKDGAGALVGSVGNTGAVLWKNSTNSTTAFQVQDSSGASIFNVDTTNAKIGTRNETAASTNSAVLTIKSGDVTGTTSNSGNVVLKSGNATGISGNLTIDAGTGATVGTISIGTANSPTINIGNQGTSGTATAVNINGNTGTINIGNTAAARSVNIGTGAAAQTVNVGSASGTSQTTINAGTNGLSLGNNGVANTIQIGNTTGAVAQNVYVGNNATASSTTNVTVGSTVAGTTTIQNAATINMNAATIVGNATTQNLFNTVATTVNAFGAATVLNIGGSGGTQTFGNGGAYTLQGSNNQAITLKSQGTGALTLTSTVAATWSTTAGNLTLQAGSGTVSLGTSVNLTANGALTVASGAATALTLTSNAAATWSTSSGALTLDAASTLNLGTSNATGVSISKAGVTTTVNGALTVTQVSRLNGNVGINIGAATPTADLTFGESASARTINALTRTTNAAGTGLTVTAGAAGAGASAFTGGTLTLQGGAAAGTGNANGGSVTISGGAGTGTGVLGLVNISPAAFSSVGSTQNFAVSGSLTSGLVDAYSTIPVAASAPGVIVTIPVPAATNQVVGRLLYISNVGSTNDFGILLGGSSITIALKPNTSATLIWNGNGWTAAGASSSTDLQAAYNNTLTSAGGAELVLNAPGGAADGFTIRNNATTAITGGLLEVQTSVGSNILSVNNNATEYASNGGAESVSFTGNWTASPNGGTLATVARTTTAGEFATGIAGVKVTANGASANQGAADQIAVNGTNTALTPNLTYTVSFTIKANTNFKTLDVVYSKDGTNTGTTVCATAKTATESIQSRISCTFTAPSSGITSSNAIFIRQSDAVSRIFYIDNLSVNVNANTNLAADGVADSAANIGGGINNWVAIGGSVAQSTTVLYDTAGSVAVTTSGTAGRGVYNNLSNNITPSTSTAQYRVSFYARGDGTNGATLGVNYSPDNGSTLVPCKDYSTQTVAASSWTLVSCYFTTTATTVTTAQLRITQTGGSATVFYVDGLNVNLNNNNSNNVQIGGGNLGGPTTLLTLDRSSGPPIAANNDSYLGSMYYDTTTGRIQCYEADGWGACGSSPDNIVTLTPEYAGAVLGGPGNVLGAGAQTPGIGVMTSEFCSSEVGTLVVGTLCANHEARNYYHWTSPQATEQVYSIYVVYKLPTTFKNFNDSNTIKLTALTDNTSNAKATLHVFKKNAAGITTCGSSDQLINTTTGLWQQQTYDSADETTCGFAGGDNIVFKIDMKSKSSANIYVENLDFVYNNN